MQIQGSYRSLVSALALALITATGSSAAFAARAKQATPPPPQQAAFAFSAAPTDEEFLRVGLFAEPLAPVLHGDTEDNRDLAKALMAYKSEVEQSGAPDAVTPLVRYLDSHPASPWRASLQLNLGMIYRQTGHFSKALAVWQDGWEEAKNARDAHGEAIANALVARLSQLEAYLGRKELLSPLLDSIKERPIGGSATQLITNSREGLYDMTYKPEDSFRCGPLALKRILYHTSNTPSALAMKVLEDQSPSTDHGLSLSNVKDIAARAGMHYQAAFRSPGAPVIYPAVVHWNVGHYAALVDQQKDGRYLVQDTTFGEDIRISQSTLNEEASGYFLIPAGPLPTGWRTVSEEEGSTIWGRGDTGQMHDGSATGPCGGDGGGKGGCTTASAELEVVGLQLDDTPVGYHPPVGPEVRFSLYYSHRDMQQQLTSLNFTNFGSRWTFTWLSYVTYDTNSPAQAQLYRRGGGAEPFTFQSGMTVTTGPYSQSVLKQTLSGSTVIGFTVIHSDGSSEVYSQGLANGATQTLYFMTAVKDKAGNAVTLSYDGSMRITAITDAIGQVTTLTYGNTNPLLVTKITDPFGRSASFTYNGAGYLSSITDVIGITSSYTYGQGTDPSFINTLTTPYGNTTFVFGDVSTNPGLGSTRFLKTTDPLGRVSYVEFDNGVDPGDSSNGYLKNPSLAPTNMYTCDFGYLKWRNTFVWDANQYQLATAAGGLDYSLAHVIHWHHSWDYTNTARTIESEKQPLENRVWYNYPGQSPGGCNNPIIFPVFSSNQVVNGASNKPSAIGRVLDDGSSQVYKYQYNSQGNVTQYTDPVGRQWSYTYDSNNIDLLTTTNTTTGSDLIETRTYNTIHEPLTIKGANGKTAHYVYNVAGQLTKYTDALGNATTLAYDGSARLKFIQGAIASAKYAFTYDNVSRIATATDPAGTVLQYKYDVADRPLKVTHPDGTAEQMAYTLLDMTSSTDRLGQATRYKYDADREVTSVTDPASNITKFGYNSAGVMSSITDANGHATTLVLDAQSRLMAKQYANGTSISVVYQSAMSLTATVTDALFQTRTFSYGRDNAIAAIAFSGGRVTTPSVSFTYDPAYPRPLSMTDGTGTTNYIYNGASGLGALQLKSETSPVAGTTNTDTLLYSYDALDRAISLAINGQTRSVSFDAIGRPSGANNSLDSFTYGYTDGTSRTTTVSSSGGPTSTLAYFGPMGDELIQQITHTTHSGGITLAQYGYTYNADDLIKSFSTSSPTAQTINYGYDGANRLTSGLIGTGTPQYQYGYDHASNLTSISPNGASQTYSYSSTNGISGASYDSNGSPTSQSGATYKWDSANRLVSFAKPSAGASSSFAYDGLGRLVRIVDRINGSIVSDRSFTWCGVNRCVAHDNLQTGSPITAQYFDQGAVIAGANYYYLNDHLGSTTALVTSSGSVAGQYTYDPYGNRTVVSGVASDISYAGYFYHSASNLNFALYRSYDPAHARWLSRDPAGEAGGINLYGYVDSNPLLEIDPLGLWGIGDPLPQWIVDYSAGFGDTLSFGYTDILRDLAGINEADKCSIAYDAGELSAILLDTAIGGAAGLEASSTRQVGQEFSHWIPRRMGGPRSPWNGNYVSPARHYYHDPYRYPRGWRDLGPKWPRGVQQADRLPNVVKGGAAGAAAGSAAAAANGCDCH